MPSRILKTPRRIVAARCDDELFHQLARAASTNGRSVSGEMRYRVQRSFAADEALTPPLKHRARRTETPAPR